MDFDQQQQQQQQSQGPAMFFCHICKSEYKQPKLLKCLHSFCANCLLQCISTNASTGAEQVVCPLCSYATSGVVREMTDNVFLQRASRDYVTGVKDTIAAKTHSPQFTRKLSGSISTTTHGNDPVVSRFTDPKIMSNLTDEQKTTVTSHSLGLLRSDALSPKSGTETDTSSPVVSASGYSIDFRRVSVDRGDHTTPELEQAVNNISRLQGKVMSLQGEALKVTYAIDRINEHTINWHQHKEDLKREVQNRSHQFQVAAKRMERQILNQIESKSMEDQFYAKLDRGKVDLRRNLKNILHQVAVLKNVHERGQYSEINALSAPLLGPVVDVSDVVLDMLNYQLDLPTKPIDEIVSAGFGNLITSQEESKVYVPERKDFINIPLDQLMAETEPVREPIVEGKVTVEELSSSTGRERGRSSSRRAQAKAAGSKRYTSDLGLRNTNVLEHLHEFQSARESFRARREEILKQGLHSRDVSPMIYDGRNMMPIPVPNLRQGRVQSLDRSARNEERTTTIQKRSVISKGSTSEMDKSLGDGRTTVEAKMGLVRPHDLNMPSPIIEESSFQESPHKKPSGVEARRLEAAAENQSAHSTDKDNSDTRARALSDIGRQRTTSQGSSGRQSSFDDTPPDSPTSENADSRIKGRDGGRTLRKALSNVTDYKSKMEFLRENWQKRKEILIQSHGFVSSETTPTAATGTETQNPTQSPSGSPTTLITSPGLRRKYSSGSGADDIIGTISSIPGHEISANISSPPKTVGSQFTSASSRYQQSHQETTLKSGRHQSATHSSVISPRNQPSQLLLSSVKSPSSSSPSASVASSNDRQQRTTITPDQESSPEWTYEEHVETITIPINREQLLQQQVLSTDNKREEEKTQVTGQGDFIKGKESFEEEGITTTETFTIGGKDSSHLNIERATSTSTPSSSSLYSSMGIRKANAGVSDTTTKSTTVTKVETLTTTNKIQSSSDQQKFPTSAIKFTAEIKQTNQSTSSLAESKVASSKPTHQISTSSSPSTLNSGSRQTSISTISSLSSIPKSSAATLSHPSTTIVTATTSATTITSVASPPHSSSSSAAASSATSQVGKYSRRYVPRTETIDVAALLANMYKPSSSSSEKSDADTKKTEKEKEEEKENVKNQNEKLRDSQVKTSATEIEITSKTSSSGGSNREQINDPGIISGSNRNTIRTNTSLNSGSSTDRTLMEIPPLTIKTDSGNSGKNIQTMELLSSPTMSLQMSAMKTDAIPLNKNHTEVAPTTIGQRPTDSRHQRIDETFGQTDSNRRHYDPSTPLGSSASPSVASPSLSASARRRNRRHTVEISKTLPDGLRLSDMYKPVSKETELTMPIGTRDSSQPQLDLQRTVIEESQDEYNTSDSTVSSLQRAARANMAVGGLPLSSMHKYGTSSLSSNTPSSSSALISGRRLLSSTGADPAESRQYRSLSSTSYMGSGMIAAGDSSIRRGANSSIPTSSSPTAYVAGNINRSPSSITSRSPVTSISEEDGAPISTLSTSPSSVLHSTFAKPSAPVGIMAATSPNSETAVGTQQGGQGNKLKDIARKKRERWRRLTIS